MNARIYSVFLSFYPPELRRSFGAEMIEVFLEDLEDARRRGGRIGAARVWWRSWQEVWRIALPEHIARRELAVPLIVWALQACYLGAIALLVEYSRPGNTLPVVVIAGTGVITAVIARIALFVCDRSIPQPLKLGRP